MFLTPAYNNEVITLFSSNDRLIVTKHKGSSPYSAAATVVRDANGLPVLGLTNKSYRNDGYYWDPEALNQNDFLPAMDGRYNITATYTTYTPALGTGNELQIRPKTLQFRACAPFNYACSNGGARTEYCPPEDPGECTGGGGGGGTRPYHLRRVVLTQSMEPFAMLTNVGNEISQEEVEALLDRSTPAQLDEIAEIMLEVYDEDIYEYMRLATGNIFASPFQVLTEALIVGGETQGSGEIAPFVSFLRSLQTRYTAETDAESNVAPGDLLSQTGFSTAASFPTSTVTTTTLAGIGGSDFELDAWPNPTTERITVRMSSVVDAVYIYDMIGRQIAQLPVTVLGNGTVAIWDLSTSSGARVAPGRYQIVVDGTARRSIGVTVL